MTVPRPVTRCSDVVDTLHGTDVPDPYRWLEDAADPEVRAWVESQGAYSRSILDAIPERAARAVSLHRRPRRRHGAAGAVRERGGRPTAPARGPRPDERGRHDRPGLV